MDLTKIGLPDSVIVSGKVYKIKTGHSYWFRFAQLIGQEKKYLSDFDNFYVDGNIPDDRQAGIDELCKFYYEEKELPRSEGGENARALDYDSDSDYIYAALMQCYGVDLFEKQYHWHKVRAMIAGLVGTRLNDIMQYRISDPGKNRELQRMKRIWALPEKVSQADKEALERFNAQFN